jgi:LysM repeat protein
MLSAEDLRDPNDMNDEYGEVYQPEPYEAPKGKQYKVKKGDSFWRIAQEQMGGGSLMDRLAAANNKGLNAVIHPGDVLNIPEIRTTEATTAKVGSRPAVTTGRVSTSAPAVAPAIGDPAKLIQDELTEASRDARMTALDNAEANVTPSRFTTENAKNLGKSALGVGPWSPLNLMREFDQGARAKALEVPATILDATRRGAKAVGLSDLLPNDALDVAQHWLRKQGKVPETMAGQAGALAEKGLEYVAAPGSGALRNAGVGAASALAHGGGPLDAAIEGGSAGLLSLLGMVPGGLRKLMGKGSPKSGAAPAAVTPSATPAAPTSPGAVTAEDLAMLNKPAAAAAETAAPKASAVTAADLAPVARDWRAGDIGGAERIAAAKAVAKPAAKKAPAKTARKYKKEDK